MENLIEKAAREVVKRWEKYSADDGTMGDLRQLGLAVGDLRASLSGLPPSPIERAAREYVEAEREFTAVAESRVPDHVLREADARMNAAYDRLVAFLSSLPQEGAAGEGGAG